MDLLAAYCDTCLLLVVGGERTVSVRFVLCVKGTDPVTRLTRKCSSTPVMTVIEKENKG